MKKRVRSIIGLLLIISLCFGQTSVFADTEYHDAKETVKRVGEEYTYSNVMYFNSSQERIDFPEVGEITAKIMVKSDTKTSPLFFAVLCYEDGKLKNAGVASQRPNVTSDGVEYTAKVNVTSDQNVKLVGVLWENAKAMTPVCVSAISTSSDARLSYLAVDNGTLNFDMNTFEYEVVLEDPSRVNAPYISVATVDNGAKVEICDPKTFPGEAKVTVTSANGENVLEYTIKYICEQKLVEVSSSLPQYILLKDGLSTESKLIGNRNHIPTAHVDESLIGLEYTTTTHTNNPSNLQVILRRPGYIMALNEDTISAKDIAKGYPATDGWTIDSTGWDRGVENTYPDADGTYGNRVTFDEDGNVIATDGIVNNIPEIGWANADDLEGRAKWQYYYESQWDVRKQGWVYIDWRSQGWDQQGYWNHTNGAYSHKATRFAIPGEQVTVNWMRAQSRNATVLVFKYFDWTANDYSKFN